MTSSHSFRVRGLAFLALGASVAIPGTAVGQQRDVELRVIRGPQDGLIEVEHGGDQLAPARVERFLREFKLLALGHGDEVQARRRLESRLKFRIEQIDRVCKLSPEQRSKLNVAGRGDIKRLFAQIDKLKEKWADVAIEVDKRALHDRLLEQAAEYNEVKTETDCFGDGSLFSKVLKSTLTPEQVAVREKAARDAAIAQHRVTIRWAIGSMEPWLKLSPEQHEKLESLLCASTRPPRKFGAYDYYGLMFQASKLPEKDFKSIFSASQWQKIEQQIAEARRLEKTLRNGGFLPDEDVADAGKARQNGPISEPVLPRC
jgi:hypothetical protein